MKLMYVAPLVAAVIFTRVDAPARAAALTPEAAPASIAASTLGGGRDLGAATAGKRVDFSVVLPYRHAADLPKLLALQTNRSSAYYRHFLTAAQFRTYFSPAEATYAAAALALEKAGFSVETFANRTVLHATGTAAAADRYFGTKIDLVRQSDGKLAYANVLRATVPSQLAGARVVGLSSVITAHTAVSQRSAARLSPTAYGGALFGPDGGFGPLAIAKTEDLPVVHGYRGANSNVADLIDGSVTDSDVAAFLQYFNIKRGGPRTTKISVGGGCGTACFDGFQAVIDAEWILAVAPDASLFTYQIPSLSNGGIAEGFNAIVSDDAVNIVNFAVGACEIDGGDLQLAIEPIIAQGAAEGITFESVAFGGANLCSIGLDLPMTPANLDTLTAVGANNTIVDTTGKLLAQSAFPSSNGGVAATISLPAWQSSTPGINPAGRNVPDIVVPGAVDGVGPSIYYAGVWQGGFTFVNNAPFAGYLATVQQLYGYATPLGNIAPSLYATFNAFGYASHGKTYFTDVTLGNIGAVNGIPVAAKKGYDLASGIGALGSGFNVAQALGFGPLSAP